MNREPVSREHAEKPLASGDGLPARSAAPGGEDADLLTIGAMARLSEVTVRTLRYYEEMDLIGPVKRSAGKYRLYSHRALKRIKAILALQDLGYALEEILVTLGPYSQTGTLTKGEQIQATRSSLSLQRDCIETKLKSLAQMKADVESRLHTLDALCQPCWEDAPNEQCHEHCSHRDVHYD